MATLRFAIIISLSVSVPWGLALAGDAPVPEAKQGQSALESSIELTQQISLFNQQIVYLESEVCSRVVRATAGTHCLAGGSW